MKILFVCTGNTCRSTMAEAMFKRSGNDTVRSAGVAAETGAQASRGATLVMGKRGIDLAEHRAQMITEEMVEWADMVLTMTKRHKEVVCERFPAAKGKIHTIKDFALSEADKQEITARLHALYASVDEKRRQFALKNSPNIADLQIRRSELLAELQAVEEQLVEMQGQLRELLYRERQEIEKVEAFLASSDVADPFGQGEDIYLQSAEEIELLLAKVHEKLKETS
ncbi:MAG: low molecular weight protein arginine phosphatase [Thermaerobacter sp.]|nr:low molecular weight protein arginine phosphatase [Thermaerobacter sp.]